MYSLAHRAYILGGLHQAARGLQFVFATSNLFFGRSARFPYRKLRRNHKVNQDPILAWLNGFTKQLGRFFPNQLGVAIGTCQVRVNLCANTSTIDCGEANVLRNADATQ